MARTTPLRKIAQMLLALAFLVAGFGGVMNRVPPASAATAITNISANASTPALYDVYEVSFDLSTTYSMADRFDPARVSVTATFNLPGGGTETVPGFYKQDSSPRWAVRYAPRRPGTYSYTLKVVDSSGTGTASGPSFTTSGVRGAGFISVDPSKPRRLMTSNGQAFVINGTNMAWSDCADAPVYSTGGCGSDGPFDLDFAQTLTAMADYKLNWGRLWANV